eukprot:gene6777-4888_t
MSSIAPLRTDDQALIKSASLLGSLRSIVEELVMNSLEADARNVDVYVDSSKNLLMVKDDGIGIRKDDLLDIIGKWGMSSKAHNHQGRSLAAIRHICETLEVISKTSDSAAVFSKKMNSSLADRFSEVSSLVDTLPQQGTIVIVANVFSSLPVRQRCINWQREIVGIRDWITALSLFHHKINWTIRELSSSQLCYRIKNVEQLVIQLLKLLQEKFAPSMAHAIAAIEQKYGKSSSIENVSSADTTKVTTNSPALDKFLLEQALQKAIQPQTPSQHSKEEVLSEAFNVDLITPSSAWQRTLSRYSSSPFTNVSVTKSSHFTPEATTGKGVTVARFTSELVDYDNDSSALRQNALVQALAPLPTEFVGTHNNNISREEPHTSSPNWFNDDESHVEGEEPEVTIGDYMIRHEMVKDGYMLHQQLESPSQVVDATTCDDPSARGPRVRNPDNAVNTNQTSRSVSSSSKRPRSPSKDGMEQSKFQKISESSPWTTLLPHTRPLALQRSSIMSNIQCIGQVDRKYIACIVHESANSSSDTMDSAGVRLFLLLDQHAVDERINLELMQAEATSPMDRRTIILSPPQRLNVDLSITHTLHEQMALFRSWCFTYQIYQRNDRTSHYDVVSFDAPLPYDGGSSGPFMVEVLSVPLIHGDEVLTADDLIEFCTLVQMQRDMPDSLLAPPAVHRILTSKACRSSLKFGQFMEQQEMNLLLSRWQQTRLPFQCAHGRPSAIPLLDLTAIEETLEAQEAALASVDLLPLLAP